MGFDANLADTQQYFKSAANIDDPIGEEWSNPLMTMCTGARDCFDLPAGSAVDPLYEIMEMRPQLFIAHHNPPSGGFFMQFGCTNCGCMTPHYQPHQDQECLGLLGVPANISGKHLKVHCRTTFREFIAQVLGWDVKASRCRFRYTTPSSMTTPMLANFAAAGTNEA